jgi:SPASM domain peptide maturase of grasp-with-spasm system
MNCSGEIDFAHFKLFACCIIVKGAKRSCINDLQRGVIDTIPNILYELLEKCMNWSLSEVLQEYGEENTDTIEGYFNWLIKKEYGFWCKSKEEAMRFGKLSNEWDMPFTLTNAIIDIGVNDDIIYPELFEQISSIGIPHIQLRSYSERSLEFYSSILNVCEGSRIKDIAIITPIIEDAFCRDKLELFCRKYLRVNSLIFHNAPFDKQLNLLEGLTQVDYVKEHIINNKCCGSISSKYFRVTQELFNESQKYNTCLNRKISVDVNGEIKNCPSMAKSFGNIRDTTLWNAFGKSGYKDLWHTNKGKISVCKDCEFRHACTDCRAFLEDPNDALSKPLKCGYDPYTATWSEWSANPLKKKAIEYYTLRQPVQNI